MSIFDMKSQRNIFEWIYLIIHQILPHIPEQVLLTIQLFIVLQMVMNHYILRTFQTQCFILAFLKYLFILLILKSRRLLIILQILKKHFIIIKIHQLHELVVTTDLYLKLLFNLLQNSSTINILQLVLTFHFLLLFLLFLVTIHLHILKLCPCQIHIIIQFLRLLPPPSSP